MPNSTEQTRTPPPPDSEAPPHSEAPCTVITGLPKVRGDRRQGQTGCAESLGYLCRFPAGSQSQLQTGGDLAGLWKSVPPSYQRRKPTPRVRQ